jgi:type IV pilus biogenesis protein CpaD/CtpE
MRISNFIIIGLLGLTSCGITTSPDYSIKLAPTADGQGYVAMPPACPAWSNNDLNLVDNQPLPQFGCATSRNLAIMVDRPEDLIKGRTPDAANGASSAAAMERYNTNKTTPLINPTVDMSGGTSQ